MVGKYKRPDVKGNRCDTMPKADRVSRRLGFAVAVRGSPHQWPSKVRHSEAWAWLVGRSPISRWDTARRYSPPGRRSRANGNQQKRPGPKEWRNSDLKIDQFSGG